MLCTPTMISKGFMQPDDLCLIDMAGKQLAGKRKRSSEALMHLEILKARPDVSCVVHCHPPHATAFAIVGEPIPQAVMPEVEVFLGEVPITKYETPGGRKFAETVLPFVAKTNIILLANHGAVSYGPTPERAYWLTEILDQYCRILLLTRQLGPLRHLPAEKSKSCSRKKRKWASPIRGMPPTSAATFARTRRLARSRRIWRRAPRVPAAELTGDETFEQYCSFSRSTAAIKNRFWFDVSPAMNSIDDFGLERRSARRRSLCLLCLVRRGSHGDAEHAAVFADDAVAASAGLGSHRQNHAARMGIVNSIMSLSLGTRRNHSPQREQRRAVEQSVRHHTGHDAVCPLINVAKDQREQEQRHWFRTVTEVGQREQ